MNGLDVILVPLLVLAALIMSVSLAARLQLSRGLAAALSIWHTMFCIVYWAYAQKAPADANVYYQVGLSGAPDWSPGTKFVESFTGLFAYGLGFGKVSTFLVYNLFGLAGLLLLARMLFDLWPYRTGFGKTIPYVILLLPGLSFWSSAIGKDAPAFLAVNMAVFSSMDLGRRKVTFGIAVLIMFLVRPHVASIMLFAAGIALFAGRGVGPVARIATLAAVGIAMALAIPFAVRYVGLEDGVTLRSATDYIELRQSLNMEGGGGVDISSMSPPMQMFTYLFRPLFFDAPGLMGLIVSFENLLLLALSLIYVPRAVLLFWRNASLPIRFNAVYATLALIIFATTTANLGLAIRQKTMVLPSVFILIALAVHALSQNKTEMTATSTESGF